MSTPTAKVKPNLQPLLNRIEHGAARLGVSRSWMYREIGAGRLKVIKIGTRSLIAEAELQRFAAELARRGSERAAA
jgi:excisionase family DNA binding protein